MLERTLMPLMLLGLAAAMSHADIAITLAVNDETGAAARVNAPAVLTHQFPAAIFMSAKRGQLALTELLADGTESDAIPVQLESNPGDTTWGALWWLMPSGAKGERTFRLRSPKPGAEGVMAVRYFQNLKRMDVVEGARPVLRYNHGETAVPEGIGTEYARGDYISPLYGPNGEVLTEDYPFDHAHHRAVCWSWATIQWRDEARDMFAVRGARARPTRYVRKEEGPVLGVIEAESEWKWDDETPIVDECAIIRVFRQTGGCRFIDVEVQLRAIVDGLSFAGRLGEGYGGFSVRMAPGEGQQIVLHNDPPDAVTRRSWADYSAEFPGGDGRSGLTIIQYAGNPQYPSGWLKYPPLNFFQPAYPGGSLVPMPKGEVIVLKYRLWVHTGAPGEETLADLWTACNKPPSARVQD